MKIKLLVVYAILLQIAQPVSLVLVLLLVRLVHVLHLLLHRHRHHHHLTIYQHRQIVQDMAQVYVHPDIVKNSVQIMLINVVQLMQLRIPHIAQTYKKMIHAESIINVKVITVLLTTNVQLVLLRHHLRLEESATRVLIILIINRHAILEYSVAELQFRHL